MKLQLLSLYLYQRFTQNATLFSIWQYYSDILNKQKPVSGITTKKSSLVNMAVHLWGESMGDQWFPVQRTINVVDFPMSWNHRAPRVKSLEGMKKQTNYNITCIPTKHHWCSMVKNSDKLIFMTRCIWQYSSSFIMDHMIPLFPPVDVPLFYQMKACGYNGKHELLHHFLLINDWTSYS